METTLFDVPHEVCATIVFSYLTTKNILALRLVCQQFNSYVMSSQTWRNRPLSLEEPLDIQSLNHFVSNNNHIGISSLLCYETLPPLSLCSAGISSISLRRVNSLLLKDIQAILEECVNLKTFKLILGILENWKGGIDLKEKQLNLLEIEFWCVRPRKIATKLLEQCIEYSPNLEVIKHRYKEDMGYDASLEFNQLDVLSSRHLKTANFKSYLPQNFDKLMQQLVIGSSNTLQHAVLMYWDSVFIPTSFKSIPMSLDHQFRNLKYLKCAISHFKWLIDSGTINIVLDSLKVTLHFKSEPHEYYLYITQIKDIDKLVFHSKFHALPDGIAVDTLRIKSSQNDVRIPTLNMKCRHYFVEHNLQFLESLLSNQFVTGLEELTIINISSTPFSGYKPKLTNKVAFQKVNLTICDDLFDILECLMEMIEMTGLVRITAIYRYESDSETKIVVLYSKAKYLVLKWAADWIMLIALLLCFPEIQKFRITFLTEYKKITCMEFAQLLYTSIRRLFGNQVQEVLTQFETYVMCEATGKRRMNSNNHYGYILTFNYLLDTMTELEIIRWD
jgi:hypothetical protein